MQRLADQGQVVRSLQHKPQLDLNDLLFEQAFWLASAGRGDMGGPIRPTEIFSTVERFCRVDPVTDLFEEYVFLLRTMDAEYLAVQDKRRRRQRPPAANKPPPRR